MINLIYQYTKLIRQDMTELKINYSKESLRALSYELIKKTPLDKANYLSELLNNNILLKREDLQTCSTSKIRGVFNKLSKVNNKNIVCATTGNHGYSVSYVGKHYKMNVYVIVPKITQNAVINKLTNLGANVIVKGDDINESLEFALEYAKNNNYEFIHPFDDHDIIIGNSVIGLEILESFKSLKTTDNLDSIFVPIGGGGLIAGIAGLIKELYPNIKIIGVGANNSCSLYDSIKNNKITEIKQSNGFIDCSTITKCGKLPFEICLSNVDDIILVDDDEICSAIKYIYDDLNIIIEPASAMSVAGIIKYIDTEKIIDKNIVAVLTAGKLMNFNKLKYIAERANIGSKSEILIQVTIPEEKGSLMEFLKYINNSKDMFNITKFHYTFSLGEDCRKHETTLSLGEDCRKSETTYNDNAHAKILLGMASDCEINIYTVMNIIEEQYKVKNVGNIPSIYLPFLVSNCKHELKDEYMFSFVIPERSGSLMELLSMIGCYINITLFHYDNIGDINAHILIGIQLINITYDKFIQELKKVKFLHYSDCTYLKSLKTNTI